MIPGHMAWSVSFVSFLTAAFGINSILYQRGIYPPETFTRVNHYDMSLLVTTDATLKKYLSDVVSQLKGTLGLIFDKNRQNDCVRQTVVNRNGTG